MSDWYEFKSKLFTDPEFKAYCDKMRVITSVADAIMDTRILKDLSREELSKLSGVRVSKIRKYENMDKYPDIPTLKRLAEAMGCTVKIQFIPIENE